VDTAIHGNWVGIDASGRALLGRALCSAFGGEGGFDKALTALLKPADNERAMVWGRAIRLAQRFSGGTESLLRKSSVALTSRQVVLTIPKRHSVLFADAVSRRLRALAISLDREPVVELA
jgi:exopolyphosphatase/guanosine-5'-triphosphate,3'-diphosphate pyrophosphatase